jgi:subtilisin family serine protease
MLRLRTGAYDPLRRASVENRPLPARTGASGSSPALYVVQFSGPIRREWRHALESTGAAVLEYLPDFSYLVRAAPSAASRFGTLPGYRWYGDFDPVRSEATKATIARIAQRSRRRAPVTVDVMTLPGEDVGAVARRLPGMVLQRSGRHRGLLRVSVAAEAAASLAAVPGVEWVEPYVPPVLFNDVAAGLMQVPAAREAVGLFGRGQVVAVADTGLDVGSPDKISADFRGRIRHAYALSRSATGDWSDLNGHGTHVCGSVLGSGALSGSDSADHLYEGSFAGMAPEASLVIQSIGSSSGVLSLPADLGQLFLPPYQNDGVRIHSDSWGSSDPNQSGMYLSSSWQLDDLCTQMRDLVVLFAAGNEGIDRDGDGIVDAGSLSPQASAKNIIAVGSSESVRNIPLAWGHFPMYPSDPIWSSPLAGNPSGMAAFSSRGPTADGRMKPDLVAPGTWILSARSHAPGAGVLWGAYNGDYVFSGGTSMSAPLAAGAAALVREGLQEKYGMADPSSAVVKAALLNGADELAPGQYGTGPAREIPARPNPVEGWGRLNVRQALGIDGSTRVLPIDEAAGLQTGDERKYTVTVVPGDGPLRVTLVWTDPPSSVLAGPQLVNDLDLKLLTPDGQTLLGNGALDRLNNAETVEIPQPALGVYTVAVDAYNVPEGPQPYAVVVAGSLQAPSTTSLQTSLHTSNPALPIAGADLAVTGPRAETLTSGAEGRVTTQLPAGSYTLTPSKPGWSFDPPSRSVTLTDGQTATAEFTATAASGALAGTVTGTDGRPIGGVAISLSPGGLSGLTAADGSYRFASLPPIDYTAAPMLPGTSFTPASTRIFVPAGGSARADFTVATAAVAGTVLAVGPPEASSLSSAHPTTTFGTRSYLLSRQGAHWIRVHFARIDVQPGDESVTVINADRRAINHWSGAFSDTWSTWTPGSSVTIQHTASGFSPHYGFDVDAVQTDLGGKPLPDAAVALQPGGLATRTDSSGGFTFGGLSGAHFDIAPLLSGWTFFPPVASVNLPFGRSQGSITFLAQGPAGG